MIGSIMKTLGNVDTLFGRNRHRTVSPNTENMVGDMVPMDSRRFMVLLGNCAAAWPMGALTELRGLFTTGRWEIYSHGVPDSSRVRG